MVETNNFNIIDGIIDDVDSIIDNDIGIQITYTPVTITTYGADQVNRVDGTPVTRYIILYLAGQKYVNLDEGFFMDSDAVGFGKTSDTYARDSKISYGGNIYRIKNLPKGVHVGGGLFFTQRIEMVRIE